MGGDEQGECEGCKSDQYLILVVQKDQQFFCAVCNKNHPGKHCPWVEKYTRWEDEEKAEYGTEALRKEFRERLYKKEDK